MKATGPLQIDANREDSIDALTLEPIRNPFLFAGKLYERSTLAKLLGRTRLVGELGKRVEYNPKMRSSPSLSLPTTTTTTRVVSPPDSPQTRSMEPPPSRHNHVQSYNGLEALLKAVEHDQLKQGMPTVELGPQKGTPTIRQTKVPCDREGAPSVSSSPQNPSQPVPENSRKNSQARKRKIQTMSTKKPRKMMRLLTQEKKTGELTLVDSGKEILFIRDDSRTRTVHQ